MTTKDLATQEHNLGRDTAALINAARRGDLALKLLGPEIDRWSAQVTALGTKGVSEREQAVYTSWTVVRASEPGNKLGQTARAIFQEQFEAFAKEQPEAVSAFLIAALKGCGRKGDQLPLLARLSLPVYTDDCVMESIDQMHQKSVVMGLFAARLTDGEPLSDTVCWRWVNCARSLMKISLDKGFDRALVGVQKAQNGSRFRLFAAQLWGECVDALLASGRKDDARYQVCRANIVSDQLPLAPEFKDVVCAKKAAVGDGVIIHHRRMVGKATGWAPAGV